MRTWLEFGEASVTLDPTRGTFRTDLRRPLRVSTVDLEFVHGRFRIRRGLIATAVVIGPSSTGAIR
jgi:4'-phosphopantetheinyl transferase EntD